VLIASALTLGATLYVRVYYRYQPDVSPSWEYSQAVFGIFVILDVLGIAAVRSAIRDWRRAALGGQGTTRRGWWWPEPRHVARTVADTLIAHRELGYRLVGFLGETEDAQGHAGLPVLARSSRRVALSRRTAATSSTSRCHRNITGASCADQGAQQRVRRREGGPDVIQYATIKAALDDLDGIPIISLNEVPLQGWNSMVKRLMDIAVSSALLASLVVVPLLPLIALLVRLFGGKGPVLLRQERMTLDGKSFQIFKFRTMVDGAEKETGPIFATADDPGAHRSAPGCAAATWTSCRSCSTCCWGHEPRRPASERPPFVKQFREHIPQYMRRHRVKSGMTGWAQIKRLARQHLDREEDRVRPLLHRELVAAARPQDPDPHPVPRLRSEARLLGRPCPEHSSPAPPASSAHTSPSTCSSADSP